MHLYVCKSDNQMLLGEGKVKVIEGSLWRFTGAQVQPQVPLCVCVCACVHHHAGETQLRRWGNKMWS